MTGFGSGRGLEGKSEQGRENDRTDIGDDALACVALPPGSKKGRPEGVRTYKRGGSEDDAKVTHGGEMQIFLRGSGDCGG